MNLLPEDELLILCSRIDLDSETKSRIKSMITTKINWNYLIHMASRQRLLQLLYFHLNNVCPNDIPYHILDFLRFNFRRSVQKNLLVTGELLRLLEMFKKHDIPAIPYKGPILTLLTYNNLSLRNCSDIEILIQKKDILKTIENLYSKDYCLKYEPYINQKKLFIKTQRKFKFTNKEKKIDLNIIWNLSSPTFSFPEFPAHLYKTKNLINFEINKYSLFSYSTEDYILLLSIYSAEKGWIRLRWLCDIAELIKNNEINWLKIKETANKLYIKKILYINIFLCNELLGMAIPSEISNEMKSDPEIKEISNIIIKRFFRQNKKHSIIEETKTRFNIRDKKIYGLIDCFKLSTYPTIDELKRIHLPPYLYFLYFFLRPFMILRKYGLFKPKIHPIYVPTSYEIVESMLNLAEVNSNDIIYDLGCGDGRIVIMAAKKYGAQGIGVDINPKNIKEAKANAQKEGVANCTKFLKKDLFKLDISNATVVTIFLQSSLNIKILEKLQKELKPNTRVVSHSFDIDMGDWKPIRTEIKTINSQPIPVYLWET